MEFDRDDEKVRWKKEAPKEKKDFDFAAFIGPDDLDDRVTEVTDGKDLLSPETFDRFTPDYIPRRAGSGEHGRHEAPEPEPEPGDIPFEEEKPVDFTDPRYAAPERPRVVVAEQRPKVYITPPGAGDYTPPEQKNTDGSNGKKSWAAAALISFAVVAVVLIAIVSLFSSHSGGNNDKTPVSTSSAVTASPDATATPANNANAAATNTPAATDAPAKSYSVTVTAGSGGSVSPAGVATVSEGGSVTFTITPNSGYVISQLLVDGVSVTPASQYTLTNVTSNHSLYAVFQVSATPTPVPQTPVPTDTPAPETPVPTDTPAPETPAPTEPPVTEQGEPAAEGAEGE